MYNQTLFDVSTGEQYVYTTPGGSHVDTLWFRTPEEALEALHGEREGCRVYKVDVERVA